MSRANNFPFAMARAFAIIFVLLIAVGAAAGGWTYWRGWREAHGPQFVETSIGETRLRVHGAYLRPGAFIDTRLERLELVLRHPDFSPAGASLTREPASLVVLVLQQQDASIDPQERMSKLYARFLLPDVWSHSGGLIMRRFDEASPYAREDLYFAPPEGRRFAARCMRPAQPPDGLPDTCISEFRQRGLDVQMRFSPELLDDWERLHEGARAMIETIAR